MVGLWSWSVRIFRARMVGLWGWSVRIFRASMVGLWSWSVRIFRASMVGLWSWSVRICRISMAGLLSWSVRLLSVKAKLTTAFYTSNDAEYSVVGKITKPCTILHVFPCLKHTYTVNILYTINTMPICVIMIIWLPRNFRTRGDN